MPLISVIIPVHNGENTLKETIDSVLGQSFQDFELIIVDDASTDKTLEIVRNVSDPRIKYLYRENRNASKSRNQGVEQAKGKYISFIDADDLWTSDKLELQLAALEKNSQAGVAYSWTNFFEGNNHYPGRAIEHEGMVFDQLILENFVASGSNILVSKTALDTIQGFDEELLSCEDWDLYLRLALQWPFVVVKKHQILYRLSSNSKSSNAERVKKYSTLVLQKALPYTSIPKSKVLASNLLATTSILISRLEGTKTVLQAYKTLIEALVLYPPLLFSNRNVLRYLIKLSVRIILPPSIYRLLKNSDFRNFYRTFRPA
jgi:glycosyltransferase involved in cell wall biosynthesis